MRRSAVLLALLGLLVLAPSAAATTVSQAADGTVVVAGDPGRDDLSITMGAGSPAALVVREYVGAVQAQAPCSASGAVATCPAARALRVELREGDDLLSASGITVPAVVDDGPGDDRRVIAGRGDDVLVNGPGDDVLSGGDGADRLLHGPGSDSFNGGNGVDEVTYADAAAAVTARIGAPSSEDSMVGQTVEVLTGSAFADALGGHPTRSTALRGGAGDDVLTGGAGADQLWGDAGEITTTTAVTLSPHTSSCSPKTTTSCTPACASSASSTSRG